MQWVLFAFLAARLSYAEAIITATSPLKIIHSWYGGFNGELEFTIPGNTQNGWEITIQFSRSVRNIQVITLKSIKIWSFSSIIFTYYMFCTFVWIAGLTLKPGKNINWEQFHNCFKIISTEKKMSLKMYQLQYHIK